MTPRKCTRLEGIWKREFYLEASALKGLIELDDLLPLVEAADLLDLANTEEGDLVLTEPGKRFADAGVLEEKQIFREQAVAHVSILRKIVQSLEDAPGHTLPEEFFLSILEKHFSQEEAQAQEEAGWDPTSSARS